MKILLVSTQDYIHHPVPSRHHYIFEYLAEKHEIHVPHFHVSEGDERKTNLIVHEATKFFTKNPVFHYTLNAPHHFKVMKRIIEEEKIDVVVAGNVLAGTAVIRAAKKHNVPILFDLKDWFPDSAAIYYKNRILSSLIYNVVLYITGYNLKKSDKITTVSPALQDMISELGYESTVIPNGVATDYFKPMDKKIGRDICGISDDDFVIGFLGSIERRFELDEVIKTLPKLIGYNPKTRLLIVGGSLFTDYLDELKKLAEDLMLSDRVIFTGLVEHKELPKYISVMDVCTIPLSSPEWYGISMSNKFFEYSACNKPVLIKPSPGIIEIGWDNTFVYENNEEFVEKIKYIMDNPKEYTPDVEPYSWKRRSEDMEAILFDLVNNKK
ncbi:glycosyltransferase family 4 protein [Methanoplanus sp. FWC-SCC4]|uniref:Glycosyltransferase family 4 protein n=1 Tax=Methanochimaera problematica TaxID=2609417 RepID=A0AA97FGN2_9EURY|nr:glycosyltransferase family 4 protein [Methanoplanus sp. FWC-SCC4]WOF17091.1 glycosyltransferase family 4 protein [Methanoplanus sp. FWC-SCC4]